MKPDDMVDRAKQIHLDIARGERAAGKIAARRITLYQELDYLMAELGEEPQSRISAPLDPAGKPRCSWAEYDGARINRCAAKPNAGNGRCVRHSLYMLIGGVAEAV